MRSALSAGLMAVSALTAAHAALAQAVPLEGGATSPIAPTTSVGAGSTRDVPDTPPCETARLPGDNVFPMPMAYGDLGARTGALESLQCVL